MCLVIKGKERITKKDRVVYKVFDLSERGNLLSPYQGMRYEYNKLYSIIRFKEVKYNLFGRLVVQQGFHSCTTLERAKYLRSFSISNCITKCIIPKKSKYYIDGKGNIVSNQIIIKEKIYEYRNKNNKRNLSLIRSW